MSYDQAYWHTESCEEEGLPEECAATHIALYVKWCISKNLISEEITNENTAALNDVRTGKMSANDYFNNYFDWKFGDWNLNNTGNNFTSIYYDQYIKDLDNKFPNIIYGKENEVNFDELSKFLDDRFKEFIDKGIKGVSWKKNHGGNSGKP